MEPQVTRELALQHGMTAEEYDLAVKALGRPPTYTELGIVSVRTRGINQRGEVVVELARSFMVPKRGTVEDAFPATDAEWTV